MNFLKYASQKVKHAFGRTSAETQLPEAAALRDGDIVISSFPCSSNNWLALLVADVAQQCSVLATDPHLTLPVDQVIPVLGDQTQADFPVQIQLPARLFRTDLAWCPAMQRSVLLYRDATDALCAWYHYFASEQRGNASAPTAIDEFCDQQFEMWRNHLESFLDAGTRGQCDVLPVAYESLHQNPVETLFHVCNFVGLSPSVHQCRAAVSSHLLEKHDWPVSSDADNALRFPGPGHLGGGRRELTGETFNAIQNRAQPLYRRAMMIQPGRMAG